MKVNEQRRRRGARPVVSNVESSVGEIWSRAEDFNGRKQIDAISPKGGYLRPWNFSAGLRYMTDGAKISRSLGALWKENGGSSPAVRCEMVNRVRRGNHASTGRNI